MHNEGVRIFVCQQGLGLLQLDKGNLSCGHIHAQQLHAKLCAHSENIIIRPFIDWLSKLTWVQRKLIHDQFHTSQYFTGNAQLKSQFSFFPLKQCEPPKHIFKSQNNSFTTFEHHVLLMPPSNNYSPVFITIMGVLVSVGKCVRGFKWLRSSGEKRGLDGAGTWECKSWSKLSLLIPFLWFKFHPGSAGYPQLVH